ncbi:Dihydroflavonol 4-reductase [Hondaea fermentalgiana]|uniref:Dihydroflavonol 4-reductase n=1 Tax=Hondaea fermentalgiana TaxID=2315210 RepID=A0A2R5GYV6_9STRA|nr:Dihydroflavonol 4-reductase [Hondaea fermentalgiana]|eukprot:GBG34998.1 Dihydroflavonol 4-reductase [Hondaea fermentalgiana]
MAAVFGCSGFVGGHVVAKLLERGHPVRGVSRHASKATWLKDLPWAGTGEASGDKVEFVDLDLGQPKEDLANALDSALQGCGSVFMCAGVEHQKKEVIDFMVTAGQEIIRAARRQGVEAVVLNSSGGSTNPPGHKDEDPKNEIDHWSDPEQQIANEKYSPAAKTKMELTAFQEVGRNKRDEVVDETRAKESPRLCIVNPNLILGPQLDPGPVNGNSLPMFAKIYRGESMNEKVPNDSMSIIDVRDLASIFVACAENTSATGRYFGVNRSFTWSDILDAIKHADSSYEKPPMFEEDPKTPTQFDFTRRDSLGVKLRNLDETMADVIEYLKSKSKI